MNFAARMPPNHQFMLNSLPMEPVSRTYQYRKIMKPMLERKRRARINKCLDELKDLMTGTLQADGENVSKLEKADILELTVRHLQLLREKNTLFLRQNETMNMEKFWAGFQHCAAEVAQFLNKYDNQISGDIIQHITSYVPNVTTTTATISSATPRLTANIAAQRAVIARELTAYNQRLYSKGSTNGVAATTTTPSFYNNSEPMKNVEQTQYNMEREMKKEILEESNNVWRPW